MMLNFHTHHPRPDEETPTTLGLHPWQVTPATLDQDILQIRQQVETGNFDMIGECGLDKACHTPFGVQMRAFALQIQISEQYHLPIVIHCVHAFNELLALRQHPAAAHLTHIHQPWVVHGYTGSPQMAQQLTQAGIRLSFGTAILHPRHTKARNALQHLGHKLQQTGTADFLLETDTSPTPIGEIYRAAATLTGIPLPVLASAIKHTYTTILHRTTP